MKLYIPTTVDPSRPTMPSRWSNASNPFALSDGNGVSYETGMVDNAVLPFYRMRGLPQAARGTMTLSNSVAFGAGGSPRLTFKQWFVAGIPFVTAGTMPWVSVLHPSWFAASGQRDSDWGGAFQGNVGFLIPYIYVYRPSDSSIVGDLAWLDGGTAINALATISSSALGPYAGGTTSTVYQWTEWAILSNRNYYTVADVAVQLGDLLCYEVWMCGRSTTAYNAITYSIVADFGRSGSTLYDQPWTGASVSAKDKNTFFYLDDLTAVTVPVQILDINDAPIGSNLTAVTPGTGPHLSLTFDSDVGITGPTIGAASDGLGVTGVTQISATQIDLACAIRPDHPDGDADNATLIPPIGEADPLGPPVPTGVGATVI